MPEASCLNLEHHQHGNRSRQSSNLRRKDLAAHLRHPLRTKPHGELLYSTDGKTFTPIGPQFVLTTDWHFFMGYRYAIFNYATQTLGGAINVTSFKMETP